ncbi:MULTISPECIES: hypothetical protein [Furfurilactobacillus]|uniref:PH domain-containing protein n=1 Tax=Furfurilactobacillus rossiae TaxID=231049 RepID=A0A7C9MUY3_9LACO|nr:hypothetical protein [Furfurilactobacillus milii]MYV05407.1 hypothetical protein [Furfurilactobacillus milii]
MASSIQEIVNFKIKHGYSDKTDNFIQVMSLHDYHNLWITWLAIWGTKNNIICFEDQGLVLIPSTISGKIVGEPRLVPIDQILDVEFKKRISTTLIHFSGKNTGMDFVASNFTAVIPWQKNNLLSLGGRKS